MKDKLPLVSLLASLLALGLAFGLAFAPKPKAGQGPTGVTKVDELAAGDNSILFLSLEVEAGTSTVFSKNGDKFTRWIDVENTLFTTSGTSTPSAYRAQCATTTQPATVVSGAGGGTALPLYTSLGFAPLMNTGTIATSSGPQARTGSTTQSIGFPLLAGQWLGCVVQAVDLVPGGITAVQPATSSLRGLGTITFQIPTRSTSTDSTSAARN